MSKYNTERNRQYKQRPEVKLRNMIYDKKRYEQLKCNPEFQQKNRAKASEFQKKRLAEYRNVLLDVLGNSECQRCGTRDKRILCFDHIKGGGTLDRKNKGTGLRYYKYYFENIEEAKQVLRVLCHNCNYLAKIGEY